MKLTEENVALHRKLEKQIGAESKKNQQENPQQVPPGKNF